MDVSMEELALRQQKDQSQPCHSERNMQNEIHKLATKDQFRNLQSAVHSRYHSNEKEKAECFDMILVHDSKTHSNRRHHCSKKG